MASSSTKSAAPPQMATVCIGLCSNSLQWAHFTPNRSFTSATKAPASIASGSRASTQGIFSTLALSAVSVPSGFPAGPSGSVPSGFPAGVIVAVTAGTAPILSAILKFTPPGALSIFVCIDTTAISFLIAFITDRCTSLPPLIRFSPRNNKGWWLTTRLHPRSMASSMTFSVTSKHNNAPETSASVNPICRPALSQSSCSGRGANRSRASSTCCIFTLLSVLNMQN